MIEAIVTGAGLVLAGIVWAVRLEGRIDRAELKSDDLKEFLREMMDTKFGMVEYRLERIEKSLNGALKRE